MVQEKVGFFRALAATFYDFPSYRDRMEAGPRAAIAYLFKLSLLTAAVGVAILAGFERYRFSTVIAPRIERDVKPAFADAPALAWKDGVLTADGTVPFKASVELDKQRLTMMIDTRDKPDTAPLHQETGVAYLLAGKQIVRAEEKKVTNENSYGNRYDGLTFAKGEAYRFLFPEPRFDLSQTAMQFAILAIELLFVTAAASIIVGGLGLAAVPEGRQFGLSGVWSAAAHGLTPGLAVFVALISLFMFTAPATVGSQYSWILWAAPLAVALVFTFLGLKASTKPDLRPKERRQVRTRDEDFLPPDKV